MSLLAPVDQVGGRRVRLLQAALVLLGPVLMFPEVVGRGSLLTPLLAMGAAVVAAVQQPIRHYRLLAWWFVVSLGAAWLRTPWDDPAAIRHFDSVAFGLLLMATVVTVCRNERRLQAAFALFCVGAIAVLAVGLLATSVDRAKLVNVVLSNPVRLNLPGVGESGFVNANALGGTAVLVAPAGFALAFLPRLGLRWGWAMSSIGWLLAAISLVVLFFTQSRSAWAAALLTLLTLSLRAGRSRRFRLFAISVTCLTALGVLGGLWAYNGSRFQSVVESSLRSGVNRTQVWAVAAEQLRHSPLLGIGINQFRHLDLAPPKGVLMDAPFWHSPHAHNIFLQVALDVGLAGAVAYVLLIAFLLRDADRAARGPRVLPSYVATGMGLSLVGVHWFGLTDAVSLGAKVGLFQWFAAGLIIAAARLQPKPHDM